MWRLIKKYPLFSLFLLGVCIRLGFIFVDYSFDVNNHIVWAKDLHERGFPGFFDNVSSEVYATLYPNYPPLALFIFYLFYSLPKIIFDVFWWINIHVPVFPSNIMLLLEGNKRLFFAGILKLPAILADIGLAWMLILIIRNTVKKTKRLDLLTASLILLNPVFIYNSGFFGQIDVIPLLFVVLSYYLLFYTNKSIVSSIFFTLSLLIKPTTLIFLPVYSVFFLQKFGVINFIQSTIISNFIFWISFLPFVGRFSLEAPYHIYSEKILAAQSLPYVTNGAFNFWLLWVDFKQAVLDLAPFLFQLSYRFWGFCITAIVNGIIIYRFLKSKNKITAVLTVSFFSAFAAVLFLTKMHERYFILSLPFLLLLAVQQKRYLTYFYFLSLLAFLNLYHSWAVPFIPILYKILDNLIFYKGLSVIGVLIFFYLFYQDRKEA